MLPVLLSQPDGQVKCVPVASGAGVRQVPRVYTNPQPRELGAALSDATTVAIVPL